MARKQKAISEEKPPMTFTKPTGDELDHRYSYHVPGGDQPQRYELVRNRIAKLAKELVAVTPCCPEQTRALNALDEALFLFNAAIARHG
jgi:hypothetical protein